MKRAELDLRRSGIYHSEPDRETVGRFDARYRGPLYIVGKIRTIPDSLV